MPDRHIPPYSPLDIRLHEAGYPIRTSTPDGGRRHRRKGDPKRETRPRAERWRLVTPRGRRR